MVRLPNGTEFLAVDSTACADYVDGRLVIQPAGANARVVRFLVVFPAAVTLPGRSCEHGERKAATTRYAFFSPSAVTPLTDHTLVVIDQLSGLALRVRADGSTESGLVGSRLFPIDEDTYQRAFMHPRLKPGEWHPIGSPQFDQLMSRVVQEWRRDHRSRDAN
jgi:hypothetical protein